MPRSSRARASASPFGKVQPLFKTRAQPVGNVPGPETLAALLHKPLERFAVRDRGCFQKRLGELTIAFLR